MNDTTDITEARTPEQALKIARARAFKLMREYTRKTNTADNMQEVELWQDNRDGMAYTADFLGDLLHELNERNQ